MGLRSATSKCCLWIGVIARLLLIFSGILFVYEGLYRLSHGYWPVIYSFNPGLLEQSGRWDGGGFTMISGRIPLSLLLLAAAFLIAAATSIAQRLLGRSGSRDHH